MRRLVLFKWALLVAAHMAVILLVMAAFVVLPFKAAWYESAPLCVVIFRLMVSRETCVLTEWENSYRQALGWPRVRGFVGHYLLGPARRARRAVLARLPRVV